VTRIASEHRKEIQPSMVECERDTGEGGAAKTATRK